MLRNEIKEALRRPNCIPSIGVVFQSTVKPDVAASNTSVDDHFVNFLRWLQPSKGDLIALCFALSYCKQKLLALAARRVLRSKLPEVNSMQIYLEIPEEIRANLIHVIQNDEVSTSSYCD
ncbi:hypothetical protein EON64_05155 [archaeon]|nr:MAG: hypothetical protein EON64_05155 [archaeon]